jgi:transcriptional regulator with XRE-family HTH domain
MATFGQIISEKRKELDLSQKELAALIIKEDGLAISPQYLNDLEHDRRNAPSDHLIQEFARVLNIPADILHHASGEQPPDIRELFAKEDKVDQEQVMEAYKAFRRVLKKEEE